jgi:hypothetical protein
MFQYASTKGIVLNGGHDYQIPSSGHSLLEAFQLPNIEEHTNPIQGLQTFNERFFHFDQDFFSEQVDDRDLFGYFQTEKYFKHIEQSIRRDFKFKDSRVDNVSPTMRGLSEMKVFSIHFRRTDYLQYSDAHPILSYEYLSAPRDDTARASCGNGAKRKLLSLVPWLLPVCEIWSLYPPKAALPLWSFSLLFLHNIILVLNTALQLIYEQTDKQSHPKHIWLLKRKL